MIKRLAIQLLSPPGGLKHNAEAMVACRGLSKRCSRQCRAGIRSAGRDAVQNKPSSAAFLGDESLKH